MISPIELVIFDCDGVLVDSERLAVRVDVRVLAELGWASSEQEVIDRRAAVGGEVGCPSRAGPPSLWAA